jgi:hypothetical protein
VITNPSAIWAPADLRSAISSCSEALMARSSETIEGNKETLDEKAHTLVQMSRN